MESTTTFDLAAALALVHRQEERNATLDVVPRAGDALLFVNVDLETRTKPDALALHVRKPAHPRVTSNAGGAAVRSRRQTRYKPVVSFGLTGAATVNDARAVVLRGGAD